MMKLFKKEKETATKTLQQLQQEFNQVIFELGDLNYRKSMLKNELSKIESEVNTRIQKADKMGIEAAQLRAKMQAEVAAKVEEGKAKEGSDAT